MTVPMKTMRRWELPQLGRANLTLASHVPRPRPGAHEVLVRVDAVSLNHRDLLIAEGRLGPEYVPPILPGSEFAGTVVDVGGGVTRFQVEDRVIGCDIAGWIDGPAPTGETNTATIQGRLAQFITVDPEMLVRAPASLRQIEAATLPVAGLTAWMAMVELGQVHAGQTVVIQGTGGVAMFAIQFALVHGARVIVITSSDGKVERLKSVGAVETINRWRTPAWHTEVLRLTDQRGADHILEIAGGENIGRSLQALTLGGRVSMVGLLGDTELGGPTGLMLFKRATMAGIGVGPRRVLEDLVRAVDRLQLTPVIDDVFGFDQVPEAFDALLCGAFGKIVIKVD